jgi:uncharacterized protein YjaG (DUF416 family)
MPELISKTAAARLMSFPTGKKVAFLLLLYERMIPALRSFCLLENRDFSTYQKARDEFWRSLMGDAQSVSWARLREDILDATPDSEDHGSLQASFALNAALVAADIAGLLADGQDSHLVDPLKFYVLNSLDAFIMHEKEVRVVDYTMVRAIDEIVNTHPLVRRERQVEEADVAFLSATQVPPWPENVFSTVRHRAEAQLSLFDNGQDVIQST